MEVVRDKEDNCIIVCSIENLDPMGVHTGDSITVAPAQTLTDKEYQVMRDASIAVLREIGVDTGGSNVQFAINPDDGRMIVIEMNPRVSRSSALASKATAFPSPRSRPSSRWATRWTRCRTTSPAVYAGVLRADHRLRRHQGAALRVREIPAGRRPPHHADEVGGRGDGDRPHLPGIVAEGAARPRDRRRRAEPEDRWTARASPTELRRAPRRTRIWYVADALRARLTLDEVYASPTSIPGSSRRSRRSSTSRMALETASSRTARRGDAARAQAHGILRRAAGHLVDTTEKTPCAKRHAPGHPPGLQARRHLRGGVRDRTAYMYSTYEEECEAEPDEAQESHRARRRAEPHRSGHRVRLLLRARRDRAARGRLRDHHGQLQPGNRLDRLRHLATASTSSR